MDHFVRGGATRSKPDTRDYLAETIFQTERLAGASQYTRPLPTERFLVDKEQPEELLIGGNRVYNQGTSFKCVAYSVCTILEYQIALQKAGADNFAHTSSATSSSTTASSSIAGKVGGSASGSTAPTTIIQPWQPWERRIITASKDYIYDHRENGVTDGMSGADGMRIVSKYGTVEEKDYDRYLDIQARVTVLERDIRTGYGDAAVLNQLQDELSQMAYRIRSTGRSNDVYAKVTSVQGLKESLCNNGPCLMILPFYNNPQYIDFWNVPSGSDGKDEMGHAVTVVGYSDIQQAFYLRNTWGPGWNGVGHVWFPYSQLPLAWEVWTIFLNGTERLAYPRARLQQQYMQGIHSMQTSRYGGTAVPTPAPGTVIPTTGAAPGTTGVPKILPPAPTAASTISHPHSTVAGSGMGVQNPHTPMIGMSIPIPIPIGGQSMGNEIRAPSGYPPWESLQPYHPPLVHHSSSGHATKPKKKKAQETIETIDSVLKDDKCRKFIKALLNKYLEAEEARMATSSPSPLPSSFPIKKKGSAPPRRSK